MEKYVIIVAGGMGSRFNPDVQKQFAELNGTPVLMHTINAFSVLDEVKFILVLPKQQTGHWKQLCIQHHFNVDHKIAEGGPKRFHSVKSGLKLVPEGCLVAIHDGVRPLASKQLIENCFELAQRKKAAIPVVQVSESLRWVDGSFSKPLNREDYKIVQTPQVFNSTLLKKAYRQNYQPQFTDDAVVFESDGNEVFLTRGETENIKITEPADLVLAEHLISQRFLQQ